MSRKNPPPYTSSYQPIDYLEDQAPYSPQFGDIYFDATQGYQQSEIIFIQGNQLLQRWSNYTQNTFTIFETGFGTGLNFVLLLQAFSRWQAENPANNTSLKLHFITTEKFPLSKTQIQKALSLFPSLGQFTDQLLQHYPECTSGVTTIDINDHVRLTLHFNDATIALTEIGKARRYKADAWFLDGFSPDKNPEMWNDALYQAMANVSADNATIATFTVAGHVRRGLSKVGFRLEKSETELKKNHILTGRFQTSQYENKGYMIRPTPSRPQHVSIIGGGIAAACTALSLCRRGIKVQLICKDEAVAQGASSNAIGAVYPLIHQVPDSISVFFAQAFQHALATYNSLIENGYQFDHQWCGLIELAHNDTLKQRHHKLMTSSHWPRNLLRTVSLKEASEIANKPVPYSGLYFERAGWVSPQGLVNALLDAAQATGLCKIRLNTQVKKISRSATDNWLLETNKKQLKASTLVIATGADSNKIDGLDTLPIYPVQGQVTKMKATTNSSALNTVVCHKGYLTPENNGIHCIGATFKKGIDSIVSQNEDNHYNLSMLEKSLPGFMDWCFDDVVGDNTRIRACTTDHLPIVGPVPTFDSIKSLYPKLRQDKNWRYSTPMPYQPNLYYIGGLGARGLCSAPLLADILTADLCGTAYPVSQKMLFELSLARFGIKALIKGR